MNLVDCAPIGNAADPAPDNVPLSFPPPLPHAARKQMQATSARKNGARIYPLSRMLMIGEKML